MKFRHLFLFFILLVSCAKENIDQPSAVRPENGLDIISADAGFTQEVVYDSSFENGIVEMTANSFTIIANTKKSAELLPGKIVPFGMTKWTPDGDIRKITARSETGDFVILTTAPATLTELFTYLKFDIKDHAYEREPVIRSINYQKTVLDVIDLEFSSPGIQPMAITPSIGYNRTMIYDIDVDFKNKVFNKIRFGVENFSLSASLKTEFSGRVEGTASIDADELEKFSIKLPNIQFSVYGVPIVITSRIVPSPEATVAINGQFSLDQSISFTQPLDAVIEVLPSGATINCGSSCKSPDFQYDFDASCEGGTSFGLGFKWILESSLFNTYDILKFTLSTTLPQVTFSTTLKTENDSTKLIVEGMAGMPMEIGMESDAFTEYFDLDIFDNPISYEFETFKTELFKKEFTIPCGINFNIQKSPEVLCSGEDMVQLVMRINSPNGSPDGYSIWADGNKVGESVYGSQANLSFLSSLMRPSSNITIKDMDSEFCRLNFKAKNPCDQKVFCEGAPVIDANGQEYCVQTMADGRIWTSSNALADGGICHGNNPNSCVELGAFYTFENVTNLNICPTGFRIPTVQEWTNLLNAESSVNSGYKKVTNLFAPNLPNFGDIDHPSGFNIIPAGIYQGWKTNLPAGSRFSDGIFDMGSSQSAFFWTTDETSSQVNLPGGASYAVRVFSSGQWGITPTSKLAGLTCRCIKN